MEMTEADNARPVDVRSRDLHSRLAETPDEVAAAQRLRYRVFVEEMGAKPSDEMRASGREFDPYDDYCDHLLVFDVREGEPPGKVIATYRFMRRPQAARAGGFYTAGEFDIAPLLDYPGEIMELGRSCADKAYRTGANMQFLWRGIAAYVLHYRVDLMFGCASLHGTEVEALAVPLSYLHHYHLAPPALRPRALSERYVDMSLLARDAIDPRTALGQLPPLIKGYLRLGGLVGEGAVVDHEFHTTDVCVVVKTDLVTEKYRRHLTRGERPPDGDAAPGESV